MLVNWILYFAVLSSHFPLLSVRIQCFDKQNFCGDVIKQLPTNFTLTLAVIIQGVPTLTIKEMCHYGPLYMLWPVNLSIMAY